MSPDFSQGEIAALISIMQTPLQHALDAQDLLRKQVEDLGKTVSVQQERINVMSEDMRDFRKKLDIVDKKIDDVRDAIIVNQEKKFKQTIAVQGLILLAILTPFLAYIIPILIPILFHH